MSEYIQTDDTVRFGINIYDQSTGASQSADTTPAWYVFKDDSDTSILNGLFTERASMSGCYRASFVANSGNGFTSLSYYEIYVSGVVDTVESWKIVKSFVLDDPYIADIRYASGVPVNLSGSPVEANVTQVSGVPIGLSTVPIDSNVVQVSGINVVGDSLVDANVIQVSGDYVSIDDFVGEAGSLTASAVADQVWQETLGDHQTVGSAGYALSYTSGDAFANLQTYGDVHWATVDVSNLATSTNLEAVSGVLVARTLVSADYFDSTTDTVAHVTLVDTTTDVTNNVGVDLSTIESKLDQNKLYLVSVSGDVVTILGDTNELQLNQGDWATAVGFATPTDILSTSGAIIDTLATMDQDIYFANVKYIKDTNNTQDEFGVQWFKNDQPVSSGDLTSPSLSVYNTSTGAALLEHQLMTYASPNLGVVRHNMSAIMASGEPYLVETSGTIDASVRTWKTIVGIDSL